MGRMKGKGGWSFKAACPMRNSRVLVKTLTPEKAIGAPGRQDFPGSFPVVMATVGCTDGFLLPVEPPFDVVDLNPHKSG